MLVDGHGLPGVAAMLQSVVTALPVPGVPFLLKMVRSGALSPFRFASCPPPLVQGMARLFAKAAAQDMSPVGPLLCGVYISGDWSCHVGASSQLPSRFLA